MKLASLAASLLTLDALALVAFGSTINVNFASVVGGPVDITGNNFQLDGITFYYDNGGNTPDPVFGNPVTAQIDSTGITGNSPGGALLMTFTTPFIDFNMNFHLTSPATTDPLTDGLFYFLQPQSDPSGASAVMDVITANYDPISGVSSGVMNFAGAEPFANATMYFSVGAPYFVVDSISYTTPEPATLLLLCLGAAAAISRRRYRRA
jgi:hypothetical protein